MYKQVKTDVEATWTSGATFGPIATLADEYGGRAQITKDDGCYILLLKQKNGLYKPTPWIFPEAFEVLRSLPSLILSWESGFRPSGYCEKVGWWVEREDTPDAVCESPLVKAYKMAAMVEGVE